MTSGEPGTVGMVGRWLTGLFPGTANDPASWKDDLRARLDALELNP
jgi:hypothetical protein